MALTSCHYSPLTLSVPNSKFRVSTAIFVSAQRWGKQLSASWVCVLFLQAMGRLSHGVDSRGLANWLQTWKHNEDQTSQLSPRATKRPQQRWHQKYAGLQTTKSNRVSIIFHMNAGANIFGSSKNFSMLMIWKELRDDPIMRLWILEIWQHIRNQSASMRKRKPQLWRREKTSSQNKLSICQLQHHENSQWQNSIQSLLSLEDTNDYMSHVWWFLTGDREALYLRFSLSYCMLGENHYP